MSTNRTAIHQGWLPAKKLPDRPPVSVARKGGEQQLVTEPLVLECGPDKVTDEDWCQIEAWIRQAVPVPGHRLQVLISICTCRQQWGKPLELRLEDEKSSLSRDQRSRVSLRHHNHDDQPVRLEITLRQIVRPA